MERLDIPIRKYRKCHSDISPLGRYSDKVYQLLVHSRWFFPGTPASFTTKTGRHDIAEILLKVALKHQKSINRVIKVLPLYLPKGLISLWHFRFEG
jgi:hypothetical protein